MTTVCCNTTMKVIKLFNNKKEESYFCVRNLLHNDLH
jgi:hypothetical protein